MFCGKCGGSIQTLLAHHLCHEGASTAASTSIEISAPMDCERCGKRSELEPLSIDLEGDVPDLCQACKDEWDERLSALLNQFMAKERKKKTSP